MNTETVILMLIADFDMSAEQINNGYCADFANAIQAQVPSAEITNIEEAGGDEIALGWHVWAVIDGRHYGADCPQGVANWMDMPIWKSEIPEQQEAA